MAEMDGLGTGDEGKDRQDLSDTTKDKGNEAFKSKEIYSCQFRLLITNMIFFVFI
jgi:hypothetical protein